MALSRSASVFAVVCSDTVCSSTTGVVRLFAVLEALKRRMSVCAVQFTPCGKYVVVGFERGVYCIMEIVKSTLCTSMMWRPCPVCV